MPLHSMAPAFILPYPWTANFKTTEVENSFQTSAFLSSLAVLDGSPSDQTKSLLSMGHTVRQRHNHCKSESIILNTLCT